MDLDIEMDVDDIQEVPQQVPEAYTQDIITGEEQEPGEVDDIPDDQNDNSPENTVVPNKIHIRGLDTFTPNHVKGYLSEHYGAMEFERVEWVNDTSANYIFKSQSAAQNALISLAAVEIADPSQLSPLEMLPGKSFSQKPESNLQVRFAVAGDKKVQGASAYSRFYLINPEYDPEERRRRGEFNRGKYRDRDDRPRRRNDRRRESRSEERNTFDVNLYDDDPKALSNRITTSPRSRRRSRSVESMDFRERRTRSRERERERPNRNKELFPERRRPAVGLRDRSASPIRDRDGDAQMDLDEDARAVAVQRSRERGRELRERLSRESTAKELFPSKVSAKKELFPNKAGLAVGGKAQMDQVSASSTILASASLADRVTARPTAPGAEGLNIRGMANKQGSGQGIAIKGTGAKVRELFPDKFGNAGKELFAEKLEGRNRRRQKAEDSFY
ncbi:hypothetical protein B0T21DRAFT_384409 [Apiosordaria backusii]|uniref:Uncharacterized protein n=1 Tax=Apiosordaria backusii TaxID=314023 RepID=A0AA40BJX4_9PEZI|nr:hypothetical protein B0T21DRAFT_384409 [Apiosordaria backusii]